MLISPAFAQEVAAAGGSTTDALWQFLPLVLIFVVFYFLLIRPQQKRAKLHRQMVASLRRGDKVMTSGGILGVVTKVVDEKEVVLEIADNVKVRVVRSTIQDVISQSNDSESKANDN